MLGPSTTKLIQTCVTKKDYLYVQPNNHQAIAFVKRAFKSTKIGSVYLFLPDRQNSGKVDSKDFERLSVQDFLTKQIADVDIYKGEHGLIIMGTVDDDQKDDNHPVAIKDHSGYVVLPYAADLSDQIEAIYRNYASRNPQNAMARVLSYSLLDGHNLYWNPRQHEYRVHDRRLLNWLLPKGCASDPKMRHLKQQWLLTSLILTLRPVFKRFSYQKPADWKPFCGKVAPLSEQIDLFNQGKSTHTTGLESINPSAFIHQLAAVNNSRIFNVLDRVKYDEDSEWIDTVKPDTTQTSFRQDRFDVSSANLNTHQPKKPKSDRSTDTEAFDLPGHIWGSYTYGEYGDHADVVKSMHLTQISTLVLRYVYFTVNGLKGHPYRDVVVENQSELAYYERLIQKTCPNGATYNAVQLGKHLYDFVFQADQPEYCNRMPQAHLPAFDVPLLFPSAQHAPFQVASDQPYAISFGNPQKARYDLLNSKSVFNNEHSEDYLINIDDTSDPADDDYDPDSYDSYVKPVVARNDIYMEMAIQDGVPNPQDHAKSWLKQNASYRRFIQNI